MQYVSRDGSEVNGVEPTGESLSLRGTRVTERYIVISADCHGGAAVQTYRDYLDPRLPRRLRRLG